jgi:hypothetical protein
LESELHKMLELEAIYSPIFYVSAITHPPH